MISAVRRGEAARPTPVSTWKVAKAILIIASLFFAAVAAFPSPLMPPQSKLHYFTACTEDGFCSNDPMTPAQYQALLDRTLDAPLPEEPFVLYAESDADVPMMRLLSERIGAPGATIVTPNDLPQDLHTVVIFQHALGEFDPLHYLYNSPIGQYAQRLHFISPLHDKPHYAMEYEELISFSPHSHITDLARDLAFDLPSAPHIADLRHRYLPRIRWMQQHSPLHDQLRHHSLHVRDDGTYVLDRNQLVRNRNGVYLWDGLFALKPTRELSYCFPHAEHTPQQPAYPCLPTVRAAAAYDVARAWGIGHLIPPTVLASVHSPVFPISPQLVTVQPWMHNARPFTFTREDVARIGLTPLQQAALFSVLIGDADANEHSYLVLNNQFYVIDLDHTFIGFQADRSPLTGNEYIAAPTLTPEVRDWIFSLSDQPVAHIAAFYGLHFAAHENFLARRIARAQQAARAPYATLLQVLMAMMEV